MIKIERPSRFILFIVIVLVILVSSGRGLFKLAWGTTTIQKNGDFTIEEGVATFCAV